MDRRNALKLTAASGAALLLGSKAGHGAEQVPVASRTNYVMTGDGERLFIRDWGKGRPVLFLAGWALPSDFWCYQMLALSQSGMRAIAYDRRGHGRSSDAGGGYDPDTLADDLASVIQHLDVEDLTVIAHSMGGTEVARYFARHGGRGIACLVLVGTITPYLSAGGIRDADVEAMLAPLSRDFPGWIEANTPPFFVPETSPDMMAWGKGLMMQTSLQAAVDLARVNAVTDFRDDVRRISVPTLLIHGERDVSAPVTLTAEATAALIPDSRLEIFADAPHGLPLTHVSQLNDRLRSFLA